MKLVFDKKAKRLFFFWGFLILFIREIKVITIPRFWAEEGSWFYANAFNHSFLDNLTNPFPGYLPFLNVLVAEFSTLFPVQAGPFITTYIALLVQLIPFAIVVFADSPWWNTSLKRFLAGMLVILLAPAALWLNSLNFQYVFTLATFLILLADTNSLTSFGKWAFRGILAVGALTGPGSLLILPCFIMKNIKEGGKETKYQTIVLASGSAIQLVFIVLGIIFPLYEGMHFGLGSFNLMVDYFRNSFSFLLPFSKETINIIALIFTPLICILIVNSWKKKEVDYVWMVLITLALFPFAGIFSPTAAEGYAYTSAFLFFLLVLNEVDSESSSAILLGNRFLKSVLILFVFFHVVFYQSRFTPFYDTNWPRWKSEVKLWKENPDYKPIIHPYREEPWQVELDSKKQ